MTKIASRPVPVPVPGNGTGGLFLVENHCLNEKDEGSESQRGQVQGCTARKSIIVKAKPELIFGTDVTLFLPAETGR